MTQNAKWKYDFKEYPAYMLRVVDGDTIDFSIDLGFDIRLKQRLRVQGIDAPEVRTKDLVEKAAGISASNFVKSCFDATGRCCTVVIDQFNPAKYDRVIGDVLFDNNLLLSELMIKGGYAQPYLTD